MKKNSLLPALILIAITVLPLAAAAGVLKNGYVMCGTKSALDDAVQLAQQGKVHLLQGIGCYATQSSLEGRVLDRGFVTSKVLIYFPSGDTATVWVASEALSK